MEWSAAQVEKFVALYTTKAAAADAIGVSRTTLYGMLKSGADKTQTLAMQQAEQLFYSRQQKIEDALSGHYDVDYLGDVVVFTIKPGAPGFFPPSLQLHKDLKKWGNASWNASANQWKRGTLMAPRWSEKSLEYVVEWESVEKAWEKYLSMTITIDNAPGTFETLAPRTGARDGHTITVSFARDGARARAEYGSSVELTDEEALLVAKKLGMSSVVETYRALCAAIR